MSALFQRQRTRTPKPHHHHAVERATVNQVPMLPWLGSGRRRR